MSGIIKRRRKNIKIQSIDYIITPTESHFSSKMARVKNYRKNPNTSNTERELINTAIGFHPTVGKAAHLNLFGKEIE